MVEDDHRATVKARSAAFIRIELSNNDRAAPDEEEFLVCQRALLRAAGPWWSHRHQCDSILLRRLDRRCQPMALSASRHKDQGPISISRGITCAIAAGLLPCVVLLLAMGYDFGREHFLLSILPTLFFVALIWLTARNLLVAFLSPGSQRPFHGWKRALLSLTIPAGFFASALGCMGPSLIGCSRTCAWLSLIGIPAAAIAAMAYLAWPRPWILVLLLLVSLGFLVPNCTCDNVVNHRWIVWLGLSPACFSLGATIALLAISALHVRQNVLWSATCAWGGVGGCLAFFVCHHFLHYPW